LDRDNQHYSCFIMSWDCIDCKQNTLFCSYYRNFSSNKQWFRAGCCDLDLISCVDWTLHRNDLILTAHQSISRLYFLSHDSFSTKGLIGVLITLKTRKTLWSSNSISKGIVLWMSCLEANNCWSITFIQSW